MVQRQALDEKRLDALARANAVRSARAELKRDLAAGDVAIEKVIAHPPAFAEQAEVSDLLRAVPGFGPSRTTRLLLLCEIPYGKTLRSLSDRQRSVLIAGLHS
jgi:hypothetical protein